VFWLSIVNMTLSFFLAWPDLCPAFS
jgi:hypothetical protein